LVALSHPIFFKAQEDCVASAHANRSLALDSPWSTLLLLHHSRIMGNPYFGSFSHLEDPILLDQAFSG